MPRMTVIGLGRMGSALIAGLLRNAVLDPEDLAGVEKDAERRAAAQSRFGIAVGDAVSAFDSQIYLLAVKPKDLGAVAADLAALPAGSTLASVMAGVPLARLKEATGGRLACVRVMPNLPAEVGKGLFAAAAESDQAGLEAVEPILHGIGEVVRLPEALLDAATAVSGSGPAYVFYFVECLTSAAISLGIPPQDAEEMVLQTVLGSAILVAERVRSPSELRNEVTSPGGTTAAALEVLESGGFRALLQAAVAAAWRRSQELS
jgi:pyrroline-5-carboxylate reductase